MIQTAASDMPADAKLPSDFDPAVYLFLNPDVKAAGMDAGQHWMRFGQAEDRAYRFPALEVAGDTTEKPVHVLTICLAHTEIKFPIHDDVVVCDLSQDQIFANRKSRIDCPALTPDYDAFRQYMGMIPGIFAAARYLETTFSDLDFAVHFLTYRVFIIPFQTPRQDTLIDINLVDPSQAAVLEPFVAPKRANSPWYLPRPFFVDSVAEHYGEHHDINDFTHFLQCAVETGVLSQDQMEDCKHNICFLPAVGIGRMPAQVFCEVTRKLERVTQRFVQTASLHQRDTYQIKFVQFCYERLGNYLIELELRKATGGLLQAHFGHWTMVEQGDRYVGGTVSV